MKRDPLAWVTELFDVCPVCHLAPALKDGHDCSTPWVDRRRFLELSHRGGCGCLGPCELERYRPRLRLIQGGLR